MNEENIEITEGSTKLLVPKGSMTEKVPPKEPAFFNPRASLSRDLSIIACSAFWKDYKFPKIFFDGLTRGQTIVDYFGVENKHKNIRVVTKASKQKFMDLLIKSLQ